MKLKGTDKEVCAVKLMDAKQIQNTPILTKLFKYESKALLTLEGDNVVNAREIFEEGPWYYVVGPLCNGGDLRKKLMKIGGKGLDEEEAIPIFRDMLKGMREMHNKKIVHRDLKPENTFIHNDVYKIADYGFC